MRGLQHRACVDAITFVPDDAQKWDLLCCASAGAARSDSPVKTAVRANLLLRCFGGENRSLFCGLFEVLLSYPFHSAFAASLDRARC